MASPVRRFSSSHITNACAHISVRCDHIIISYTCMAQPIQCIAPHACSPGSRNLLLGGGGGGGGGGAVLPEGRQLYVKLFQWGRGRQSASLMNQFVTHMHAFSTKTQGTSRQKGSTPHLPCRAPLLRPYNWVIGTFKFDAQRNPSQSGLGRGRGEGRHFIRDGGVGYCVTVPSEAHLSYYKLFKLLSLYYSRTRSSRNTSCCVTEWHDDAMQVKTILTWRAGRKTLTVNQRRLDNELCLSWAIM